MRAFAATIATTLLLTSPALATAQEAIPPSPIVKAQLLLTSEFADKDNTHPFTATVRFTMPKEWHIYWKNPGDSGIPTSVAWKTQSGYEITGENVWSPSPTRIDTAGIINYGYSNTLAISREVTPSPSAKAGDITIKANWLVCRDICIPESVTLSAKAPEAITLEVANNQTAYPFHGNAFFNATTENVALTIDLSTLPANDKITREKLNSSNLQFIPLEDGLMQNQLPTKRTREGDIITLTMPRGTADLPAEWHGVLIGLKETHFDDDSTDAYEVTAVNQSGSAASPPAGEATRLSERSELSRSGEGAQSSALASPNAPSPNPLPQGERASLAAPLVAHTWLAALALAFLGGLILNIMPCVLPILALKALALSKKAAASRVAAAKQGFSYTAGVVASFLLIAGVMLALKASGNAIGWGFQLQNAGFVAFLAGVMLLVSANLLGLFELPVLFGAKATGINEDKLSGSFFTGVLAVMVATPCTAPFMATAIGATLSFPTAQALAVFAALGLGMASPFLLISLWPAARRLLPKPGAWMKRFKHILAIPMLATAAWLVWVLVQIMSPSPIEKTDMREAYSAARLAELRDAGTPTLVDATAAWCITCKINERVALNPADMQQFLREKNVTILVADWTNSDPEITAHLASFGRNGVPLVVYYPPSGAPVVLPQVLTPSIVREAIETAPKFFDVESKRQLD